MDNSNEQKGVGLGFTKVRGRGKAGDFREMCGRGLVESAGVAGGRFQ